jgi:superfamily II DNA or RNA helicase
VGQKVTKDIIDNLDGNTVAAALTKLMPSTQRLDALVGYFYFSGFKEIYKEVKNIKIRILVGLELDPSVVNKLGTINENELDNYLESKPIVSKTLARKTYLDNFSAVFNNTDIFDNDSSIKAFKVFLEKIKHGSLEIRRTSNPEHGKFYLMTFAEDKSQEGLIPGVVIEGSSNLTYSGLKGRGEHNRLLKETHYFLSDQVRFENLWKDSENITIADKSNVKEFETELKKRLWLYAQPDPYLVYVRLLDEYFGDTEVENLRTPGKITDGLYSDLRYQVDAIELGIDRINKFGGVIIADVVGLGKSIIGSAIAHNLGRKTIVIAPPHLKDQWEDYKFEFNFNALVYTTGEIEKALDKHGNETEEMLIILDEAHKHRNEDTNSYQLLHKLCAGNRVMALTATPFNNDPKDIYALIKLFDTPGQSTLRTVENLSMEFHALMAEYKNLRKEIRKQKSTEDLRVASEIQDKGEQIAKTLRQMIEPVVIRRSRLDLNEITTYREDLEQQNISFAKVEDPELLEYELGPLSDLYIKTLNKIASDKQNDEAFIGARYKPVAYLKEGSKFFDELLDDSGLSPEDQRQRLEAGQGMIAFFMRRLLVRRFESSMAAFESSLRKMRESSERMLDWMDNRNEVPIYKKGDLPEVDDLELMDEQELENVIERFEEKGLIRIPVSEIQPQFREHLLSDMQLLKDLHDEWFNDGHDHDPKFDNFMSRVKESLEKDPKRKIVVFSEYSDTAAYVAERLRKSGMKRVFKYSAADSNKKNKRIIRVNFDAGLKKLEQENDYDVLVATDAISEGFNLHRAGAVINYDIPYNPTRVIQRIGRINRINKQVFKELYIYNFFPTFTGEKETKTKAITTLKISLIHTLLGEDTKILTSNEELRNYFAEQYRKEEAQTESLSWDARHRRVWLQALRNERLIEKARAIPLRTRIARGGEDRGTIFAFGKLGTSYVFAMGSRGQEVKRVSAEEAMGLFVAEPGDKAMETTSNFDNIYQMVKQHLFKKNTQVTISKGSRRFKAIQHLMLLSSMSTAAKDHCADVIKIIKEYDGFPDGLLKLLLDIRLDDTEKAFSELRTVVPGEYIENISKTALRSAGEGDFVLLSEEIV